MIDAVNEKAVRYFAYGSNMSSPRLQAGADAKCFL